MSIRKPHSKYWEHKKKQTEFSKKKKNSHKKIRSRIKSLLRLQEKGLGQLQEVINHYYKLFQSNPFVDIELNDYFFDRLKTIKTICKQQHYMYSHPGKKAPDRIVSLAKPWVRAIVRGKENKLWSLALKYT